MNFQLGKVVIQHGYSLLSAKINTCLTAMSGSTCERGAVFETYEPENANLTLAW